MTSEEVSEEVAKEVLMTFKINRGNDGNVSGYTADYL